MWVASAGVSAAAALGRLGGIPADSGQIVRKHDLLSPHQFRWRAITRRRSPLEGLDCGGPAVIEPRLVRPETLRRHLSVELPFTNPKTPSDVFIRTRLSNTRLVSAAGDFTLPRDLAHDADSCVACNARCTHRIAGGRQGNIVLRWGALPQPSHSAASAGAGRAARHIAAVGAPFASQRFNSRSVVPRFAARLVRHPQCWWHRSTVA
jgi:hypothetical protein